MSIACEARILANYIKNLNSFETYNINKKLVYDHVGAIYTDVILQSGLNYNNVVKPRVKRVLINYPEAKTVNSFHEVILKEGIENIINWRHPVKLNRMLNLIEFSKRHKINSCLDLKIFFSKSINKELLLEINGIGPKTLDYFLKLLNFDTVAVDRHIYSFVELAGLSKKDYGDTKKVVEFAADLLNVSRSSIDYSIWKYMSINVNKEFNHQQLTLKFNE